MLKQISGSERKQNSPDPDGHKFTIIIVVGKNCIPPIKSANASSPNANRNGLNPNVCPLINSICNDENNPFNNVVAMYTVLQLHLMKNFLYAKMPSQSRTYATINKVFN